MRLNHLLMAQHEVDIFLAQFESLAHEAQYPLDAAPTLSLLASKLPFHMMNHIYKVNRPQTFTDWATSIRQYHQDNTAVQNLHGLHDEGTQKKPAPQQKGFSPQQLAKILGIKMPTPDANAMDTHADINQSWNRNKGTRGRVSTTAPATSKDTEKQCAEGRCFTCNRQGHIARDCPNKKDKPKMPNKPKAQARKVEAEVNESDADVESEADDPDSFIKRARALKEDHKLEIRRMAITADKGEEGSDQDF
jgi:hypothetical protein